MMASCISKMNTIFGILMPKMMKISNLVNPTYLFKKLRGILIPLIPIKNVSLDPNDVIWVKSSMFKPK